MGQGRIKVIAVAVCGVFGLLVAGGAFLLAFGSPSASAAPTCSIYWTGAKSGAWATAGNWSLTNGGASAGRTPAATDYVCMSTSPTTAAVTSTVTVAISGINWPTAGSVAPSLTDSSGTFTVGTATSALASTLNALSLQGGTFAGKSVVSSSSLNLNYGTLTGTGTLTLASGGTGTLGAYGDQGVYLTGGHHLVNNGSMATTTDTVNGYNIYVYFQNASTFENAGTFTLTDGAQFVYQDSTANHFQNDAGGSVTYGGTSTATLNVPLINNGNVSVGSGGTVSISDGGTWGATATDSGSGILSLDSGIVTAASGSSFAEVRLNGGTFSGMSTVTSNMNLVYGTLTGTGTLTLASGGAGTLGDYGNQGVYLTGGYH